MAFDFSNLTFRQKELLTFHGWHSRCGRPQPTPETVRKLKERGLVRELRVGGAMTWLEYEVPLAVHIAWCEACSCKTA